MRRASKSEGGGNFATFWTENESLQALPPVNGPFQYAALDFMGIGGIGKYQYGTAPGDGDTSQCSSVSLGRIYGAVRMLRTNNWTDTENARVGLKYVAFFPAIRPSSFYGAGSSDVPASIELTHTSNPSRRAFRNL